MLCCYKDPKPPGPLGWWEKRRAGDAMGATTLRECGAEVYERLDLAGVMAGVLAVWRAAVEEMKK